MKSNDVNDFKHSTIFKNKANVFRFDSGINEKRAVQCFFSSFLLGCLEVEGTSLPTSQSARAISTIQLT